MKLTVSALVVAATLIPTVTIAEDIIFVDRFANIEVVREASNYATKASLGVIGEAKISCHKAAQLWQKKKPVKGYNFIQRPDSPTLLNIRHVKPPILLGDKLIYTTEFLFTCNGAYMKLPR